MCIRMEYCIEHDHSMKIKKRKKAEIAWWVDRKMRRQQQLKEGIRCLTI